MTNSTIIAKLFCIRLMQLNDHYIVFDFPKKIIPTTYERFDYFVYNI